MKKAEKLMEMVGWLIKCAMTRGGKGYRVSLLLDDGRIVHQSQNGNQRRKSKEKTHEHKRY